MSTVNLLDFVDDDFDPNEDITLAFNDAFAASLAVRVPVRRDRSGAPIAYRLNTLRPPRGAQILCESKDVLFEQLDQSNVRTQALFTTGEGVGEITLSGGSFGNCATVWQHSGDSQLFDCIFRDLYVSGCTYGFKISAAAGCLFEGVRIRGASSPVDWGIVFDGSGSGQTNTNSIINCKFTLINECGIVFGSDQRDAPQIRNAVKGCWFENIQGCAIDIEGNSRNLHIADCYFEKCSDSGADVKLSPTAGESVHGLVVEHCAFSTPSLQQKWRIDVSGNCAARFTDNHVQLGSKTNETPPRVFLHLDTSNFSYELSNNYLNGSKDSANVTYEDRLLRIEPGRTPAVSWRSQPGSGFVAAEEGPIRVIDGRSIALIKDRSGFDLAMDVQDGHTFRLVGGGALRLIANGYLGQQIVLLADSEVTITDDSTVPPPTEGNIELSGNSNLVMAPGGTLSLIYANLGGNNRWYEISRSTVRA